ncbi:hypothetical protein FGO68_gene2550 [Halteria grandinella]|uniref:Uncharacterized protein n=1 Tax=Halteria grandinella TaxID=5974 RepID=A0A8J8NEA4_HALGN|nr:hypothetical protein FGO68_gene2550 [Halteria grandinella]
MQSQLVSQDSCCFRDLRAERASSESYLAMFSSISLILFPSEAYLSSALTKEYIRAQRRIITFIKLNYNNLLITHFSSYCYPIDLCTPLHDSCQQLVLLPCPPLSLFLPAHHERVVSQYHSHDSEAREHREGYQLEVKCEPGVVAHVVDREGVRGVPIQVEVVTVGNISRVITHLEIP